MHKIGISIRRENSIYSTQQELNFGRHRLRHFNEGYSTIKCMKIGNCGTSFTPIPQIFFLLKAYFFLTISQATFLILFLSTIHFLTIACLPWYKSLLRIFRSCIKTFFSLRFSSNNYSPTLENEKKTKLSPAIPTQILPFSSLILFKIFP